MLDNKGNTNNLNGVDIYPWHKFYRMFYHFGFDTYHRDNSYMKIESFDFDICQSDMFYKTLVHSGFDTVLTDMFCMKFGYVDFDICQ